MARTKRGNVARKRRKKILAQTKGFRGGLSKLIRPAKQALLHALSNQYRDRRKRKTQFRQLWIGRIKVGLRQHNVTYSVFMGQLAKQQIAVNRKMLAELAVNNPTVFDAVVAEAQA